MKAVLKSLYTEPLLFLAVIQAAVTAVAAADLIPAWICLVSLAIVTALQRGVVSPSAAVKALKWKAT